MVKGDEMSKNIIFSDGTVKKMEVEELFEHFEDMIHKFAHKCVGSTKNNFSNVNDFDDYMQMGNMELMKAYQLYDEKHCFSTLLQIRLNNAYHYNLRKLNFYKRKTDSTIISLNRKTEENKSVEELYGQDDLHLSNIEVKLDLSYIFSKLDPQEIKIFLFLLEQEKTKIQLAKELGITRPTLDSRISLLRDKIKKLMK